MVNPMHLNRSSCHKPYFISLNSTIRVVFYLIYPLTTNHLLIVWERGVIPRLVDV